VVSQIYVVAPVSTFRYGASWAIPWAQMLYSSVTYVQDAHHQQI
jgi:hypothetical protein